MGQHPIRRFLGPGLFLSASALLALVPTSFLSSLPSLCLFKGLFGFECPGCGVTRAVSSALHGNLAEAVALSPQVVVVLPLLAFLGARIILKSVRPERGRRA